MVLRAVVMHVRPNQTELSRVLHMYILLILNELWLLWRTSMEPEWAVRLSGVRGKMLLFPPPLLHQGIIPSCYLPTHTILPTLTLLTPLPRNTRVPCSHNILLIFD